MLAPPAFLEVLLLYLLFPKFFLSSDVDICILKCLNIKTLYLYIIRQDRHIQTKVIESKKCQHQTHLSCSLNETTSSGMR